MHYPAEADDVIFPLSQSLSRRDTATKWIYVTENLPISASLLRQTFFLSAAPYVALSIYIRFCGPLLSN